MSDGFMPEPIGDTEGVRRLAPTEETRKAMAATIPLGRYGTKQEVADMALVLSSGLASFVTGAIIPVDGGSSLADGRNLGEALKAQPVQ
jgi:NAD(P)-dependent dehydrogenase (short-subunit alcohol dehydrogenase family)